MLPIFGGDEKYGNYYQFFGGDEKNGKCYQFLATAAGDAQIFITNFIFLVPINLISLSHRSAKNKMRLKATI